MEIKEILFDLERKLEVAVNTLNNHLGEWTDDQIKDAEKIIDDLQLKLSLGRKSAKMEADRLHEEADNLWDEGEKFTSNMKRSAKALLLSSSSFISRNLAYVLCVIIFVLIVGSLVIF